MKIIVFTTTVLWFGLSCADGNPDFFTNLDQAKIAIEENNKRKDKDSLLQESLHSMDKSDGFLAMIELWKAGKKWPAELAWWKSPYPNTRKLALALFYVSYKDVDVSQFPRFEENCDRFNEVEAKQRRVEIAEISRDIDRLRIILKPMIEMK